MDPVSGGGGGGGSSVGAVLYNTAQSLTSAQQALAQDNIGVGLSVSNGVDDAPMINAALISNSYVKGYPGTTYVIGSTIFVPANTTLDMTSCTVFANAGWSGYPVQAAGQQLEVKSPVTTNPTPSTTGGTLAAGTYVYGVSAVTGTGETMISPAKTATTTGSTGSVVVTWSDPSVPAGASAVVSYNIYGRTLGNMNKLLGNVAAAGPFTFTDTGGAGSVAAIPAGNTTFSRTAGIKIIGGTYDCNGANRPCDFDWVSSGLYAGHCFDLQKVDDCLIRNVTVLNAKKWAIAVADFGVLKTENVILNSLSDGIHVVGPGLSWTDKGGHTIVTGDDSRGISLVEWPTYAVSRGSIGAVEISDCYVETAPSALRVLGGAGYTLGTLRVKGIAGNYSGQFRGAIYIWDQQPSNGWANGTDINEVDISDVNLNMVNSPLIGTPYGSGRNPVVVLAGRNLNSVNLERITSVATGLPFGVIQFSQAGDASTFETIKALKIEGCVWTSDTNDYPLIRFADNCVIERGRISRCVETTTAGTGSTVDVITSALLKNITLEQCNFIPSSAGSGQVLKTVTGSVTNLEVSNTVYNGMFRLVDVTAGSGSAVNRAVFRNNWAPTGVSAGELMRVTSTTAIDITLDGNRLDSLSANGSVNCAASTTVVVRSTGGNVYPSGKTTAYTAATPTSVRVTGWDLPHDLNMTSAAKVANDVANNTNAGLSCGTGVALTNGTTWKNIYTGSTF